MSADNHIYYDVIYSAGVSRYDTSPDDDSQNGLLGTVFTNMRTVNAFSMQFMVLSSFCSCNVK